MSIYYRFLHERSESYRSIELSVNSIRTSDLKSLVAEHSGLSKEYMKLFDLKVLDTDEKETFSDDKLLPIYSRVVIQRIPWRELKEIHHEAQKSINNEEVAENVTETKLELPSEYICKLCSYPLINPVLIKCAGSCGASACRECVKDYLDQNKSVAIKPCPSCGQRFRGSVPNKSLANMLAAIDWDKFNFSARNPKVETSNIATGNRTVEEEGILPGDLDLSGINSLDNQNVGKGELLDSINKLEPNNSNIPEHTFKNVSDAKNEKSDSLENNISNFSSNSDNTVPLKSVYSLGAAYNAEEEAPITRPSSPPPVTLASSEAAQETTLVRETGDDLSYSPIITEALEALNSSDPDTKGVKTQTHSDALAPQQQVSQNTNLHHHHSFATSPVLPLTVAVHSNAVASSVSGPCPPPIGSSVPMVHPQSMPPHAAMHHHQYMDIWPIQGPPHAYVTQFPKESPGHTVPFHQGGFQTGLFPPHHIAHHQGGQIPAIPGTVPAAPPHPFGFSAIPPPGTHSTHFQQPYVETIVPICGPYLTEKQRIKLAMSFPMLSEETFNLIKAAQQSVKDIWALLPKTIRSSLLLGSPETGTSVNSGDRKSRPTKKRKEHVGNNNPNFSSNGGNSNSGKPNLKKRAV